MTGVSSRAAPYFVDIDSDGDFDVFVGDFYGNIRYFENTSTNSSIPAFMLQSTNNAFGLTTVDLRAAPSFVDIDEDGDFDAFVGELNGTINYFENTGNATNPAFNLQSTTNAFGLTDIGFTTSPRFLDIDSDGELEAFIGNGNGKTAYFENTQTNCFLPAFSFQSADNAFGLSDVGSYAMPVFVDIDDDDLYEAIIGNEDGKLIYFESDIEVEAPSSTVVWTGSNNTNWDDPNNWQDQNIPNCGNNVLIPDVTNDPNVGNEVGARAKSVVVEANAILDIFDGGSISIDNADNIGLQSDGTINNTGTIDIRNANNTGLENNGTFDNMGKLFIDSESSIGISNQNDFTNTGLIGGAPRNNDFNTSLGGILSPGYPSNTEGGFISFGSTADFAPGIKLVIDVYDHTPTTKHDRITIGGVANLNNIDLEVSVNYTPEDGDRVDFINASAFDGNFASTTLPPGWEVFIGSSAYMVYDEDRASCSPDPYGLSGVTTSMLDYITQTEITSTQEIESAAIILYQAATTITLQDGFHAKSGSTFTARIEDCAVSSSIESPSDEIIEERSSEIENILRVYPNPFSTTTTIQFYLTQTSDVVLTITDINGRIVQQQQYLEAQAGWQQHRFDASHLPDGMYFLHIRSQEQQVVKQLIVQK